MMMRKTSSTGKVNETTTMPPHINLLGGPNLTSCGKSRLMIIWFCVKPDWKGKSWRCKLVGCRFLFGPNPETNSSNILRFLSSGKCVT